MHQLRYFNHQNLLVNNDFHVFLCLQLKGGAKKLTVLIINESFKWFNKQKQLLKCEDLVLFFVLYYLIQNGTFTQCKGDCENTKKV